MRKIHAVKNNDNSYFVNTLHQNTLHQNITSHYQKNIYGKMSKETECSPVHLLFTHLSHVTYCLHIYQTLKFCKILKRIAILVSISL